MTMIDNIRKFILNCPFFAGFDIIVNCSGE